MKLAYKFDVFLLLFYLIFFYPFYTLSISVVMLFIRLEKTTYVVKITMTTMVVVMITVVVVVTISVVMILITIAFARTMKLINQT